MATKPKEKFDSDSPHFNVPIKLTDYCPHLMAFQIISPFSKSPDGTPPTLPKDLHDLDRRFIWRWCDASSFTVQLPIRDSGGVTLTGQAAGDVLWAWLGAGRGGTGPWPDPGRC